MIPLNYIYENQYSAGNFLQNAGASDPIKNFHRKECAQLLDEYGMIVGYTCVEEKARFYESADFTDEDENKHNQEISVIPEELYESLMESANAVPVPSSPKKRATKKAAAAATAAKKKATRRRKK